MLTDSPSISPLIITNLISTDSNKYELLLNTQYNINNKLY